MYFSVAPRHVLQWPDAGLTPTLALAPPARAPGLEVRDAGRVCLCPQVLVRSAGEAGPGSGQADLQRHQRGSPHLTHRTV